MNRMILIWLKRILFRPKGINLGRDSFIRRPWTISHPTRITIGCRSKIGRRVVLNAMSRYGHQQLNGHICIGDDAYIGHDCQIHAMQPLLIQAGCVLSDRVYVNDASHGIIPNQGLIMAQPISSKGPIVLGEHVFVGYGSVILPGVELGHHCVVAAQSVVTRSQPPGTMVAGNPARPIKRVDFATGEWISLASHPNSRENQS